MSQESQTVGSLIDVLLDLKKCKPETPAEASALLSTISVAEDAVQLALSFYGGVVHKGEVWWTYLPPRTSRLGRTLVHLESDKLPWPPRPKQLPEPKKPEPLSEKIAGFIPPREMDK
jgi:hypothetical protein